METPKFSKTPKDSPRSTSIKQKKGKNFKPFHGSKFQHGELTLLTWLRKALGVILIASCFLLIWGFHKGNNASLVASLPAKPSAVPVVLTTVRKTEVPIYLNALGSVAPMQSVVVKTQINGQLLRVFFKEGQLVKAGDLLAEIDPKPYQAQLLQYEGQLAHDKALLENAKHDLKRYENLHRQDSISQQTLDTQIALVKQYEGNVKSDEGQIKNTQLKLDYCKIISPIEGKIGLRRVDPGNFVQTTDAEGLAVINTIHPIAVLFSIPEDNIPDILKEIAKGNTLKVEAYDRAQNKLLANGFLLTLDNQIDPTTGTVKIKAQFKNEETRLFPNQFVNIRLLVTILPNTLVIPSAAIQQGIEGPFVYRMNSDRRVSKVPVTVMTTNGEETAVEGQLAEGQAIVLEGADKLQEGTEINGVYRHSKDKIS